MANTWQGSFPHENLALDGYERTSPVMAFPPNRYGVYDMIGNVWEWTTDFWSTRHPEDAAKACCVPQNPRGGPEAESYDPCQPAIRIPRKVLKGGSHLCAPNYCRRYRPARNYDPEILPPRQQGGRIGVQRQIAAHRRGPAVENSESIDGRASPNRRVARRCDRPSLIARAVAGDVDHPTVGGELGLAEKGEGEIDRRASAERLRRFLDAIRRNDQAARDAMTPNAGLLRRAT